MERRRRGENDPFGGTDLAQPFVKQLPYAKLELVVGAGHAVWINDPDHAATTTRGFRGALEQHVHDEER